jgi:hypothetical protein
MSVTLDFASVPFVSYERFETIYDGRNSGSMKCIRGYGGANGGVWQSLESGGRFCDSARGRNLASFAIKLFSHVIYFIKKLYKCTFSAIGKDNAAVNGTTVQYKEGSFLLTSTGPTTLVAI